MLDWPSLLEFSHRNCIAICATLVPLNLIATLVTLTLTAINRPKSQILQSISWAISFALLMVLHVMSWLVVGVVRVPTFVLFALVLCCLVLNLWALLHPSTLQQIVRWVIRHAVSIFQRMTEKLVQKAEAS